MSLKVIDTRLPLKTKHIFTFEEMEQTPGLYKIVDGESGTYFIVLPSKCILFYGRGMLEEMDPKWKDMKFYQSEEALTLVFCNED